MITALGAAALCSRLRDGGYGNFDGTSSIGGHRLGVDGSLMLRRASTPVFTLLIWMLGCGRLLGDVHRGSRLNLGALTPSTMRGVGSSGVCEGIVLVGRRRVFLIGLQTGGMF